MSDPCCDRRGPLFSIAEAAARVCADVSPVVETELLPIALAHGRILAEPVRARVPLPIFDNAAVDGYAVACDKLTGVPPFNLRVVRKIAAGQPGQTPLSTSGAVRIFTGAPVPPGFDAVVMQERCCRDGDRVTTAEMPAAGLNIRHEGEDVAAGEQILAVGVRLDARHVALAAAVGASHLRVRRRLRAAVFSTGNELRDVGGRLPPATVYDSNRPMIAALLSDAGIEVTDLGISLDEPARTAAIVGEAATTHDLLVSSGGVSVGDEDHVATVMAALCPAYERLSMKVKPGKPAALGRFPAAVWLAVPGNAFAAFVVLLILGRPLIRTLSGRTGQVVAPGRPATASFCWSRKTGRDEFFPVREIGLDHEGLPLLEKLGRGGSARLRPLVDGDGLALAEADIAEVRPGTRLTYLTFSEALLA